MKLPVFCPSCDHTLTVSRMLCSDCGTEVSGTYDMPVYLQLTHEEQNFIMDFFLSSGSIKEMAKRAGNSYPTMRNRMDDMIDKIKNLKK